MTNGPATRGCRAADRARDAGDRAGREARGVTHFSPVDGIEHYRSARAEIAWLRYLALGDAVA
ncbi:hypothetical protein ABZV58_22345 [Nocardia sp. NPDC004654]|uniref:hypothetical protein n=1 Tax=Nocardia sp. NPDC004654 TaxID=3154776 RepID=UPI0033A15889